MLSPKFFSDRTGSKLFDDICELPEYYLTRTELQVMQACSADFPSLEVLPVVADFTKPFPLPQPPVMPARNLVYFPGSTIGNFDPAAALGLLHVMYQEAGENGALLIGEDLQKDKAILEGAYNDAAGVTAEFNLNILRRLNN